MRKVDNMMDSTKILNKSYSILNKMRSEDYGQEASMDELFENIILLLKKYKVNFDLESFIKVANEPFKQKSLETIKSTVKDKPEFSLNLKKSVKRLLNNYVLYLLELLQDEVRFERSLDRIVDLLEYEFESLSGSENDIKGSTKSQVSTNGILSTSKNSIKNKNFMQLFLSSLFYGNYYHLGIVQHFLLNSRHSQHLPKYLNSVIKQVEKTKVFKKILNNLSKSVEVESKGKMDSVNENHKEDLSNKSFEDLDERFDERFLIFVTKLKTPDVYRNNDEKGEVLKIPRKDLSLRNPVGTITDTYTDVSDEMDNPEVKSSGFDGRNRIKSVNNVDSEDDISESDEVDSDDEMTSEEQEYATDYIKLWETIVDIMLYRVNKKNLVIILESLPTRAFPYMYNPLKVANFLHTKSKVVRTSSTSNVGKADQFSSSAISEEPESDPDVAINSLNCLFELILYYNLTDQIVATFNKSYSDESGIDSIHSPYELDWFYKRLDSLIEFEYLSSSSSVVLSALMERALNSSMLPNKLVSYFIKRLIATATVVETSSCNCLLVIALHLLQKHHHHLVHQISAQTTVKSSFGDVGRAVGDNESEESMFLQELYLLLNHFNNDTVKIVGVFFTHLKNKITFNLEDFKNTQKSQKHIEKSKNTQYNPFRTNIQNSTTITRSLFS